MSGSRRERQVHLTLPVILLAALAIIHLLWRSVYKRLVMEDGPVEYATCAAYLLACLWGLALTRKLGGKGDVGWATLYAGLSMVFFFIAMEEISWGQRILQMQTPEYFKERNIQGEIGVHNLSMLRFLVHPTYMAVGVVGAFGSRIAPGLGVPPRIVGRLLPPPHLGLYFLPCFLFYLVAEIVTPLTTIRYAGELTIEDPHSILALPAYALDVVRDWLPMWRGTGRHKATFWRHQEPVEFLLALGFLFFVISRWRRE